MAIWLVVTVAAIFVAIVTVSQQRRLQDMQRRILVMQRRADSLQVAYGEAKARAGHEQAISKRLEQRAAQAGTVVYQRVERASQVSDSLKGIPDTADIRDALQVAVAQIDSLTDVTTSYVVLIDSTRDQHARERLSMSAALAQADSTIAVQKGLIEALRADRCRVLGLPCPSRSQAFIGGALLVTLLVLR